MGHQLRRDLNRWTDAGLISADQARAITDFERVDDEQRWGFLAEGLGYVGAALAVGAGFLVAQDVWDDLSTAGRLTLIATLAFAMFLGGWALRRQVSPSIQRLTDVLWLGSIAAAGAFAALFAVDVAGFVEEQVGVAAGATIAIVGAGLWTIRRRSLELIEIGFGVTIATVSLAALVTDDLPSVAFGSIIWLIGIAFFAAGHFNRLTPSATARLIGVAGVAFGSQVLAGEGGIAGAVVAAASAGAVIAYAMRTRDDVSLAVGGVMVLLFVPQLVFAVFGDTLGAPVALFVTGVALVAIAVSIHRARAATRDE